MWGSSAALASSQCCWSPRTHTENFGLGRVFSLCIEASVAREAGYGRLEIVCGSTMKCSVLSWPNNLLRVITALMWQSNDHTEKLHGYFVFKKKSINIWSGILERMYSANTQMNRIELQQKDSYPYHHRDPCPVDLFGNVMQNDRHEDRNLPVQSPKAFPHILRPRVGVRLHRLHQPKLGQLSQTTQSTSPCLPLACLLVFITF